MKNIPFHLILVAMTFLPRWVIFSGGRAVANDATPVATAIPSPEALFADAERAWKSRNFAQALATFELIQKAYPDLFWSRAQRSQLASTRFHTGATEKAEIGWGKLLCESPNDPMNFNIALQLAKTQRKLGKLKPAYLILSSLPSNIVMSRTDSQKKEYFDLSAEFTSRLGNLDSAARIYLAARALLGKDRNIRAYFWNKFTRTIDTLGRQDPDKLQTMSKTVTDPNALAYLKTRLPTTIAAKPATQPLATEPAGIEGLKLKPVAAIAKTPVAGPEAEILEVRGRYQVAGWQLYCGGIPLEVSATGKFKIDSQILEHSSVVQLFALGPNDRKQQQVEAFFISDWKKFKPEATDSDDFTEDDEDRSLSNQMTADTGGCALASINGYCWHVSPAIGGGSFSYNQTGLSPITVANAILKTDTSLAVSGPWSAIGNVSFSYSPFANSTNSVFFFDLGLGMEREIHVSAPFSWTTGLTVQYENISVTDQNYGFKKIIGPQLASTASYRMAHHQAVGLEVKTGLRDTDSFSSFFKNYQLGGGALYSFQWGNNAMERASLGVDYNYLALNFSNGAANVGLLSVLASMTF